MSLTVTNTVCTSSGDLQKMFGTNGSGPKELNNPRGIAVAGNQVFVCDRDNHRVQVLTTELEPVKQIGSNGTGIFYPTRGCHRGQ